MRHLVDKRKLGRTTPHRLAMLKNMATSLIHHGRIQTTLPKAKELRRLAERLITFGKRGTIVARRKARRFVQDRQALAKLFQDLAPRFAKRNGGYTRILKLGHRAGDQAPLAFIEYVDYIPPIRIKEKPKGKSKAKLKESHPNELKSKAKS